MADAASPDATLADGTPAAAFGAADVLLAHGDDAFELDATLERFAARVGSVDRSEIIPERRPDERAIDRAAVEAASIPLFGGRHVVVLRQPLQAVGPTPA
ncbi:MAG: hypothetical protein M3295_05020, partial [Chloroflexota bacterium]|nr:hypothetical protein [Chloroflexota bacterium]